MKDRIKTLVLYTVLIVLTLLFFFSGPDYYSARSFKNVWNLGHIIFYTLLSSVLLQEWKYLKGKKASQQLIIILLITIGSGLLIEWLQVHFNRISEFSDIRRDILGAITGWVFFSYTLQRWNHILIAVLRTAVVILIILEILPTAISLHDELLARQQFPVLSDFERNTELERWEADNKMTLSDKFFCSGKYSARISLTTEKYSGIFLNYFPRNWTGYNYLKFCIYNSESEMIKITCRIHDQQHMTGVQKYEDRYNKQFNLKPGWNQISIPLVEVRNAPFHRKMDLSRVYGFGLFSVKLQKPVTIFLDNLRLSLDP